MNKFETYSKTQGGQAKNETGQVSRPVKIKFIGSAEKNEENIVLDEAAQSDGSVDIRNELFSFLFLNERYGLKAFSY